MYIMLLEEVYGCKLNLPGDPPKQELFLRASQGGQYCLVPHEAEVPVQRVISRLGGPQCDSCYVCSIAMLIDGCVEPDFCFSSVFPTVRSL